jgi:hypothetical protein
VKKQKSNRIHTNVLLEPEIRDKAVLLCDRISKSTGGGYVSLSALLCHAIRLGLPLVEKFYFKDGSQ